MWSEVAQIYRASKKRVDINWWTEWICRPIAAICVYALRNTRITPNQVTFLSAFVCVGAAALLIFSPSHLGLVAAILVLEASFVLDCADGQLARVRQSTSPLGHLLDFLMDEIKAMLILAAVAVRLWQSTNEFLFLLVGLAALFLLASGMSLTTFTRRPEYGATGPTKDGQPATIQKRRGLVGLAMMGLEHSARTIIHYPSYIWLLAIVNRIDIYFWAYAAVAALYFVRIFLSQLIRFGQFAPKASQLPRDSSHEHAPAP